MQRRKFLRDSAAAVIGGAVCARAGEPAEPVADVCVYGATASGLMAAVAAAREGASVVVVEPSKWIGGMVAGGLTRTDKGREETIGGLAREFFTRAAARYEDPKCLWYAEPHLNLATFEAMAREAKLEVVRRQRVKSVERDGARLLSLTTAEGRTFAARMFIDASYEGDLMALAGVSHKVGRESRGEFDEPLAGFHPMPVRTRTPQVMASVCPCIGGRGPHYIHGTPSRIPARDDAGRLLPGVWETNCRPGDGDDLTQSYNFRLTVTKRPELMVPFPKPAAYDPARYELLLTLIRHHPRLRFGRLVHFGQVSAGKFDMNAQGLFSTDYVGGNRGYPAGSHDERERIRQDHLDYVQGFLWFLGHDERVPRALRDEVHEWGLCGDEFTDHRNWPHALYVREARRMRGEFVMTQKDCQKEFLKPDPVAMGSFAIDCHIVQRIVDREGMIVDEGSFADAPTKPYQVPYRCITPRREECPNLLVPVCISASHVAYGSLRMEPVYMALGQTAGIAAVLAGRAGLAVQQVPYDSLHARLKATGQVMELPPKP